MIVAAHPASALPSPSHSLQDIPFFQNLAPDILAHSARAVHRVVCEHGQFLTPMSEMSTGIHFVGQGSIRLYRSLPTSQELTLATRRAGDPFVLLPGDQAEALCNGTLVYCVPRPVLMRLLATQPQSACALVDILSQQLAEAFERMEDVALGTIMTRLARLLVRLASAPEGQPVMLTHYELAQRIGARQEDVTKTLRHLRERGLVASQPRQRGIVVPDPAALVCG